MNLERVIPQNSNYMVLKKISEFSNKYLCIELEESSQKTNKGETITALDAKNIEQFKGKRRFFILEEKDIIENIDKKGLKDEYKLNVYQADLVSYNGLRYVVLGIVINTYAQWNIPTPFLFNISDIVKDYVGLYSSKLNDFQINELVNDNFQAGKYDNDMLIPLIDLYETNDDLKIIERRPSKTEVDFQIERYNSEKNLTLKAKKNIFIDTILANRMPEINLIRESDDELYESMKKLITSVNGSINKKIQKFDSKKKTEELDLISKEIDLQSLEEEAEDLFESKLKQTINKKPSKQKVEQKIELEEIPDNLESKPKAVYNLPIQVQKLYAQRQKDIGKEIDINIIITAGFRWDTSKEGIDFWENITNGNFKLFKEKYGNKGEGVDITLDADVLEYFNKLSKPSKETVESKIDLEEIPDTFAITINFPNQLPIQIQKLYLQRQKDVGNKFNLDVQKTASNGDGGFGWTASKEEFDFWGSTLGGDFKIFKQKYGSKGEKVDDIVDADVLEFIDKKSKSSKETVESKIDLEEIPDIIKKSIMYAYELPIQIQKLFLQRQKDAGNKFDIKVNISLSKGGGGFNWDDTKEGREFWYNTSNGRFVFFKDKYGSKGEKVDDIVDADVLEFIDKKSKSTKQKLTKETKVISSEEKEILRPGSKGTYGKKREKITILNVTPKIVNFITESGIKKGIYIESFLKNFIKE
jgi:hypothetical protein